MPIITISRGSYSFGRWIAGAVAQRLDYECTSRDALLEASREFDVPEARLVRAIHDAPSFFERMTHRKERYIAIVRKAFLEMAQEDNVVYHGLAGHFFLSGVSHVIKVRILAELEDRVAWEMEREEIPREEALKIIRKDDEERRKWSLTLYGIDTADASLYDLVVRIRKLTAEDAADLICRAARAPEFQTTPESQGVLDGLVREARAECAKYFPDA
jgi:cytidylate kinase